MKQAAAHTTTKSRGADADLGVGTIALTFLDTAWRIAVPVILFAVLGIMGDRHFGSKPWLTLLCTVVGFVFAGLLVQRQLAAVTKEETKK